MFCATGYFEVKCLSIRSRNRFATFVDTAWLNGGLNHMMFLCLLCLLLFLYTRLYLKSTFSYPLFLNAVSYSIFDTRKISAFEEFLHYLSIYVMIWNDLKLSFCYFKHYIPSSTWCGQIITWI